MEEVHETSTISSRVAGQGLTGTTTAALAYYAAGHGFSSQEIALLSPLVMAALNLIIKVLRNIGKQKGWDRYISA